MLINYLEEWDFNDLCVIYSENKIPWRRKQLSLWNEKYLTCSSFLIMMLSRLLYCLEMHVTSFLIAHSARTDILYSWTKEELVLDLSTYAQGSFLHRFGIGRRVHLCVVAASLHSSFLLERIGKMLCMQPQVGWNRRRNGPNLGLGNYRNRAFVCHF